MSKDRDRRLVPTRTQHACLLALLGLMKRLEADGTDVMTTLFVVEHFCPSKSRQALLELKRQMFITFDVADSRYQIDEEQVRKTVPFAGDAPHDPLTECDLDDVAERIRGGQPLPSMHAIRTARRPGHEPPLPPLPESVPPVADPPRARRTQTRRPEPEFTPPTESEELRVLADLAGLVQENREPVPRTAANALYKMRIPDKEARHAFLASVEKKGWLTENKDGVRVSDRGLAKLTEAGIVSTYTGERALAFLYRHGAFPEVDVLKTDEDRLFATLLANLIEAEKTCHGPVPHRIISFLIDLSIPKKEGVASPSEMDVRARLDQRYLWSKETRAFSQKMELSYFATGGGRQLAVHAQSTLTNEQREEIRTMCPKPPVHGPAREWVPPERKPGSFLREAPAPLPLRRPVPTPPRAAEAPSPAPNVPAPTNGPTPPPAPTDPHHQILRDHLFLEEVNKELYGTHLLLEKTSLAVFDFHNEGAINSRQQRQRWRQRGTMRASDEGTYCNGCRWQVDPSVASAVQSLPPLITREQAVEYIEYGRRLARRQRVMYSRAS